MKQIKSFITILLLSLFTLTGNADEKLNRVNHFNLNSKGIAIKGYDPVSYFTQQKPTKGKANIAHKHQGVTYLFSSIENRDLFKTIPSKYEPQQGGWCAYAFAKNGGKVKVNPKRFKIIDGKLYLFYDTFYGPNTLKLWNKSDDASQVATADKQWNSIRNKK